MRPTAAFRLGSRFRISGWVSALAMGGIALFCGCRQDARPADRPLQWKLASAAIGGLSLSLPAGFVRKTYEQTRETLPQIPGTFTDQIFASWEADGGQSFCLFYWSVAPPHDLGPMVAARQWKAKIAGQETEVAETVTFMGLQQRVLVAFFEKPGGRGRYLIYARNLSRESFDSILATMRF